VDSLQVILEYMLVFCNLNVASNEDVDSFLNYSFESSIYGNESSLSF
jgi:hypothetical protein